MRWVLLALRLFLAAVFLYAAYTKLRDPWMMFAMSIDAYQILPEWAVLTLGRTLPWLELLLGLLLAVGLRLRYMAVSATVLLGAFFAIMLWAFAKGMAIDCGCFGPGDTIGPRTLVRDGILLAMSGVLTVLALQTAPQDSRRAVLD
jgi:uncharacterized membrane protein YphA (DoxX/SURF4 family)